MTISFQVTIAIPNDHRFPMFSLYKQGKKEFIENWLQGAIGNIITGPLVPLPKKEQVEVVVTMME